jgi:hypothetical protein
MLTFTLRDLHGAAALTPHVDGSSLVDLVSIYESARGYVPAGGYAGLVLASFGFGDLTAYFKGVAQRQWPRPAHAWLLGCDCGEVGCWPLTARIEATEESVTWTDFAQDHRPDWAYTGFGPFVFDATQYVEAVKKATSQLE